MKRRTVKQRNKTRNDVEVAFSKYVKWCFDEIKRKPKIARKHGF